MIRFTTIKESQLFNTGFLSNTTLSRQKQGLYSQEIANQCKPEELYCNNKVMYPFPATQMVYDKSSIPRTCDCVRFLYTT